MTFTIGPSVIPPTVGRVVLYSQMTAGVFPGSDKPRAAVIAEVHSERLVNLCVFDAQGNTHARTSVTLVQPGDTKPTWAHCEWMEYQIQKAGVGDHNSESAEPRPR